MFVINFTKNKDIRNHKGLFSSIEPWTNNPLAQLLTLCNGVLQIYARPLYITHPATVYTKKGTINLLYDEINVVLLSLCLKYIPPLKKNQGM